MASYRSWTVYVLCFYERRCKTGDWFVIRNISRGWKKMLRISKCDNFWKRCVDLNTGITFNPIDGSDFQLYDMLDQARRINNIIKKKKNDLEAIVRIQALQRGRIVRQNVPPVELLVAIKEHDTMMQRGMRRIGELHKENYG